MTMITCDGLGTSFTSGNEDAGRSELEEAIRRRYARAYGACIEYFHERLLGMRDETGAVLGVIGCTRARPESRLFVERYVDDPIEVVLSNATGRRVERQDVVEVGNLISEQSGLGRCLLASMIRWLDQSDIPWAVFAATRPVRLLLRRMGLEGLDLGEADGARLGESQASWGTYYDAAPRLLSVYIPSALEVVGAYEPTRNPATAIGARRAS